MGDIFLVPLRYKVPLVCSQFFGSLAQFGRAADG